MNFEPFDRLPVVEWAPWWDKTVDRWQGEGLPADMDCTQIDGYLGLDEYLMDWPCPRKPDYPTDLGEGLGPVGSMADYERIREQLYPTPAIDRQLWQTMAKRQAKGEAIAWLILDGAFWFPRKLLGIEKHLYSFYDQPELLHKINSDLAAWQLGVIEEVFSICTPDIVSFEEDMSYNHGPMLSEQQFDDIVAPYYAKVLPVLKGRGIVTIVDSDGDITKAAGWFERAGADGMLPLERQSGVDIAQIRAEHPKMKFIGGYDKMVMNKGVEAMRAEFERLLPVAAQGGFIVGCDHQTPPGVSFDDYKLYLELFREYADRAGQLSQSR